MILPLFNIITLRPIQKIFFDYVDSDYVLSTESIDTHVCHYSLSLSACLFLAFSLYDVSLSLSVSFSLSVILSLPVCLSLFHSHTHIHTGVTDLAPADSACYLGRTVRAVRGGEERRGEERRGEERKGDERRGGEERTVRAVKGGEEKNCRGEKRRGERRRGEESG